MPTQSLDLVRSKSQMMETDHCNLGCRNIRASFLQCQLDLLELSHQYVLPVIQDLALNTIHSSGRSTAYLEVAIVRGGKELRSRANDSSMNRERNVSAADCHVRVFSGPEDGKISRGEAVFLNTSQD